MNFVDSLSSKFQTKTGVLILLLSVARIIHCDLHKKYTLLLYSNNTKKHSKIPP